MIEVLNVNVITDVAPRYFNMPAAAAAAAAVAVGVVVVRERNVHFHHQELLEDSSTAPAIFLNHCTSAPPNQSD